MWTYDVYAIPVKVIEQLPDDDIAKITLISAFSKYLDQNPLGVFAEHPHDAFILLDSSDSEEKDYLESLGFVHQKQIQGDCDCCRGTKTLEHEKELPH